MWKGKAVEGASIVVDVIGSQACGVGEEQGGGGDGL